MIASVALIAACGSPDADGSAPAAPRADERMPVHIDSILPIEEEIRRFTALLGDGADSLVGGAVTRDALVAEFVRALEQSDTAALVALRMTPAEFIDLYYPFSMYARPPYELSPSIVWMLSTAESDKGLSRLVDRLTGAPFGFLSYTCDEEPKVEGENRFWQNCRITRSVYDEERAMRYFGAIWERAGHFKLLSFANDF